MARGTGVTTQFGALHGAIHGGAAAMTLCRRWKMSRPEQQGVCARFVTIIACAIVLATSQVRAAPLEFTLHQIDGDKPGPTVLVIGGIQGDEPGGFNAASLLATHYQLRRGALWVVPNLNFESIVQRSRGVHGDMNRKFATVLKSDPDYARVVRIKAIITDPKVDYVLNLHDGSGFYRPQHIDSKHNPKRWGQSIIIDQETMPHFPYSDLEARARRVTTNVNHRMRDPQHRIHVKNTRTGEGDVEMAKTLTYFAINESKPAVGIEASKSLPTHLRAYYHLKIIEAYLHELGVVFERHFSLTPKSVRRALDENIKVAFFDRRMTLNLAGARSSLRFVPMKKNAELHYEASSPLVAVRNSRNGYRVSYGNRRITRLYPQFFEFDSSLEHVAMIVDGDHKKILVGGVVDVHERFSVTSIAGFRVNVIGWRRPRKKSDADVDISRASIDARYSVDRAARVYRVEFYRGTRFAGMVLIRFVDSEHTAFSRTKRPLS
jgi:hypothetical protein